jgi:type IV secretion system protein VirB10
VNTRAEVSQSQSDSNNPLATTARNLEDYQRQLQGLLETLTRSTALATKDAIAQAGSSPSTAPPLGSTLAPGVPFGGPPARGPDLSFVRRSVARIVDTARRGIDARQSKPRAQGHGIHLRAQDQGHQRHPPGRLPCSATSTATTDACWIERGCTRRRMRRVGAPGTVRIPVL